MAVQLARSECRDGFWHVVTYDITDPDRWVEIEDLPTAQPCSQQDTSTTYGEPSAGSERLAYLTQRFLERFVPPFMSALHDNIRLIVAIRQEVERVSGSIEHSTTLATEIVPMMVKPMLSLLDEIDLHFVPPSIELGKGKAAIEVSPIIGSGTSPDAKANIGIQIDFNPSGESKHYVGRLTAELEVDAHGKPVGGKVGWQCTF